MGLARAGDPGPPGWWGACQAGVLGPATRGGGAPPGPSSIWEPDPMLTKVVTKGIRTLNPIKVETGAAFRGEVYGA